MPDEAKQPRPEPAFIRRFVAGREALTLLLLHGTGGDENDMLPLAQAIRPSAGFLSLRGNVLENGRPRFFRRLAEGVFDVPDLIFRTNELADFLPAVGPDLGFDSSDLVAVGYSNGANIAASTLLLRPGTLAAAVLFRPMVPLVPDPLPSLNGIPVFISAGTADPIVPAAETTRLVALLQDAGADVSLNWQEGGHGLSSAELETAKEWLAALYPPPR